MAWLFRLLQLLLASPAAIASINPTKTAVASVPPLPLGTPHASPPPDYMKDNVNNYWGTAPDKGSMTGPILGSLNASTLSEIHGNNTKTHRDTNIDDYWLSSLASSGQMPFAPSGYQFFRNVKDFGAVGDGVTDDTAAINRAAAAFSSAELGTLRCGADCGSTTTLGAIVYFPAGTYLISTPIVQYYYTQFVGNPTDKPVIQGAFNFTGIALFDSDFYIPGGNGAEWYINQNNFYRQIRNFQFDMTTMNWTNTDNGQSYVPTGIHWQVGQATSITNCDFIMSVSTASERATGVGIYMENGSGGLVSDLTFTGGNIGFLAGSQQFTAKNLQFTSCLTAIYSVWNWGFTWKNINVLSCYIALDCTSYSGVTSQGTGSITVLDSVFNGVPYAITVDTLGNEQPNIVLDNLLVESSASVVLINDGSTILDGSDGALYFNSWAQGYQYLPSEGGGKVTGFSNPAPAKPASLLDSTGAYFTRSKPQYETTNAGSVIVVTDYGVSNDGTGDQSSAINNLLSRNVGSLIFFPAGVYMVASTVKVPVGSLIVGSGWSQIMGSGTYFQDDTSPNVMVQVGNVGDSGIVEISDMLFTVKGPTAGAVLMEWNVHESNQGSAAMWDSHFRVGGANGSDLQVADCPAGASSVNTDCMAASMLMHITSGASGYFENVWGWVADHDLDNPLNALATESDDGIPENVDTDISVYSGRGFLIESQGPTWMYGTAAEHSQMYQYQLYNASNIYLGHMQTESPYYQPNPPSTEPYTAGIFSGDPTFEDCYDDQCKHSWALRIINSTEVFIYGAGFYSFFDNNELGCADTKTCQLGLIETSYSQGLWIYNIFTKGDVQIVSPDGGLPPLLFNDTTEDGYTSEIAAWLALSLEGGDLGSPGNGTGGNGAGSGGGGGGGGGGGDIVYIDPRIWPSSYGGSQPTSGAINVSCPPPCTYVLPPITLPTPTTIVFPASTTSLEVGCFISDTWTDGNGIVSSTSEYVSVTVTTVLTIPAETVTVLPLSNVPIVSGINSTVIYPEISLVPPPFTITDDDGPLTSANFSCISSLPNARKITPQPWPWITFPTPNITTTLPTSTPTPIVIITHNSGNPDPTCSGGCGTFCTSYCSWPCSSGCNTNGADCSAATCTQGGDCAGPTCTAGGNCDGPHCTRGGDCTGPRCNHGGHCEGPICKRGGSCFGRECSHGGDCFGLLCRHGGGCGPLGCPPGDCFGPDCETTGSDDDDGSDDNNNDGDFNDSNDPNSVNPSSQSCTTRTFSSCRTLCVAASTASCASSSTTCSDIIGCQPTGTVWASTITPAPAAALLTSDTWATDTIDLSEGVSVGVSIISWLSGIGDFGSMSSLPTTTSNTIPTTSTSSSQTSTVTTSTSTTSSPTATATAQVCLGLWTEDTKELATYAYTAYIYALPCDGVFITNGTIGTPEDVCKIPTNNDSFKWCSSTATFENSGTQFFSDPSCGFEISLNGQTYEPQDISADDNPCSGVCSGNDNEASVQGMLLYSLPACSNPFGGD